MILRGARTLAALSGTLPGTRGSSSYYRLDRLERAGLILWSAKPAPAPVWRKGKAVRRPQRLSGVLRPSPTLVGIDSDGWPLEYIE